jgi:GlpG protein
MRFLGTIEGQKSTEALVAFLLTEGISAHVEKSQDSQERWEVWVREEEKLADARGTFEQFLANPSDPRYAAALVKAREIREEREARAKAARDRIQSGGPSVFRPAASNPPFTRILVILCTLVTLFSGFSSPSPGNRLGNMIVDELKFVDMRDYAKSGDPAISIKQGEGWRLLTPVFLHGNPLHLILNVLMLFFLIAIGSNLLQGLMPKEWFGSPNFVGISGVVYGLFGFIWIKSTYRPDRIPQLSPLSIVFLLAWLAIGFLGDSGGAPMANLSHLGGLLIGMGLGWLGRDWSPPSAVRRRPPGA